MIIERILLISSVLFIGTLGSPLHGPCETDDDCGIIDTICHKGICSCRENFAIWFDSCVPLAHPRVSCTKKHDCHKTLGIKSMCTKKNQCACKAFHHLHMGQCVKNRDLHETCDHDHQCYCGADCQEKIGCIHNNCSCRAGHSPYKSRRCISDGPVILTVADQQIQRSPLEEEFHETHLSPPIEASVPHLPPLIEEEPHLPSPIGEPRLLSPVEEESHLSSPTDERIMVSHEEPKIISSSGHSLIPHVFLIVLMALVIKFSV